MAVGELNKHRTGNKGPFVQVPVMSPTLIKALELLNITIDSLMAGPGFRLSLPIVLTQVNELVTATVVTTVSTVTFNHLSRSKHLFQITAEDGYVWHFSTPEGTIDPNNPTSLNTHSDFISKSRAVEFLCVPSLTEWDWFQKPAVETINGNSACPSTISHQPISPSNLCWESGC